MTSMPRGVAACLAAAALAAAASARAQEPTTPAVPRSADAPPEDARPSPADAPPPLPAVTIQGWRLGATLYGGYDTNALDVEVGGSSREFDLGGVAAAGRQGRFSTLEASAEASSRRYPDVDGRSGWRGAAGATAGRRLSKNSVGTVAVGYRYDFTDAFLNLTEVATQLPRSTVRGLFGEGTFAMKPARRFLWSNTVRYETLDFAEQGLADTETLRLRSELDRQVSRLDRIGPRYEFLRTDWGGQVADIHSFLAGWRRGDEVERWSLNVEAGGSRATAPLAAKDSPESATTVAWRFTGNGYLAYSTGRTTVELIVRRGVTPGYGRGSILDSTSGQFSARRLVTRAVTLSLAAALERTTDRLDPAYGTQRGAFADAHVVVRLGSRLSVAAGYRYRWRDSFGTQVDSNRFGISVTSAIESTRQRAPVGIKGVR